ncbi:MAG: hypothetical protein DWB56_06700 [Candidatus Jettenia sp.]|uniref:NHL repeat protein n=1 Tax=Candidatus Jettenia caeni TaxID=247490 RepID=I3IN16_9BACT|nr:hypothetical protein [Candidatus Jettenia sp. AMX1]MBC6928642.1 hypothetical protein [Candidatus Jettenia sp.]GAB63111.1 hypothetical protein KSU1_C1515 [Candidatus Jettenia caeni]KAA0250620.1 MAG: hypothetical protein EDM77_03640 [Candidatus Jettenia sp. AMX1]MCE7879954.1 hypothetical protein [Candidatus Jettenia sp. AMX1]MCQ3926736.1 hypothetical protein [Candidatus Jettenia sp.]
MARIWNFVGKFGSAGSGNGQFNTLCAIQVSGSYIYVSDRGNARIQVFNKTTYSHVANISLPNSGIPYDLDVDSTYIYVTDTVNKKMHIFKIQDFSLHASFTIREYTSTGGIVTVFCVSNAYIYTVSRSWGNEPYMYIYNQGTYTQANYYSLSVAAFNWHDMNLPYKEIEAYVTANTMAGISTPLGNIGINDGFNAVAMDSNYIYIARPYANLIAVYNRSTLAFCENFGSGGINNGQFNTPTFIAVDLSTSRIFVVDSNNNRIQEFELVIGEAPAAPSGLTANDIGGRSVQLNWVDNS